MFKKQLTIDKYLFIVMICILINLLESWYFGLNWSAESFAEEVCDWLTTIPLVIASFWFFFSNDYIDIIKGNLVMLIMITVYGIAYGLILIK